MKRVGGGTPDDVNSPKPDVRIDIAEPIVEWVPPTTFTPSNTGKRRQVIQKTLSHYEWADVLPTDGTQGQYIKLGKGFSSVANYHQILNNDTLAENSFSLNVDTNVIQIKPPSDQATEFFETSWKNGRKWKLGTWEFTLSNITETSGTYSATYTTTVGTELTNAARDAVSLSLEEDAPEWENAPSGTFAPANTGSTGQLLSKTATGYQWENAPSGTFAPANTGSTGEYLQRTSTGYQWATIPTYTSFAPSNAGTTDQLLTKTATGYSWQTHASATPFSPDNIGSTGQFLEKTDTGYQWNSIDEFSPANTGTTGQYLTKTATGYEWATIPVYTSFSPDNSGSTNQVLTKTATGYQWSDATAFSPSNTGTTGQYLTKTDTGYQWATIPTYTSFSPANSGSTNQVLTKTATGYNWQSVAEFSPSNTGTTGQYLTKTATGYQWASIPTYTSFAPANTGTTDQVLTKTSSGYNWADASGGGVTEIVDEYTVTTTFANVSSHDYGNDDLLLLLGFRSNTPGLLIIPFSKISTSQTLIRIGSDEYAIRIKRVNQKLQAKKDSGLTTTLSVWKF